MLKDSPWIRNHPWKCLTKELAWQLKQTSSIHGCVEALKCYLQGWRRSGAQQAKAAGAHYIFQSNRSMKGNNSGPHTASNRCFTGRAAHSGDIPWTAVLGYPDSRAPLPSLDLQPVSVSPSGKPRLAILLQSWGSCHWLPISAPSPPASGPPGLSSQALTATVGSPL